MQRRRVRSGCWRIATAVLAGLGAVVFLGAAVTVAVFVRPSFGAAAAEVLRGWVGDDNVARLETVVYRTQDSLEQLYWRVGNHQARSPWGTPNPSEAVPTQAVTATALPPLPTPSSTPSAGGGPRATPVASAQPSPTPPGSWFPAPAASSGSAQGEGVWTAYLHTPSGGVAGYRTFVLPDPMRPWAPTGVVALELGVVRLHYVLGSVEPASEIKIPRPGEIPAGDKKPGKLLAVFNGGFMTRHGHFGVFFEGSTLVPMQEDLGTIALYRDGRVGIGAWGSDVTYTTDASVYRQNGPLIVMGGQVNPRTSNNSPKDWGFSGVRVGVLPTWRSALGVSADGGTLYYVAGPSLTVPTLARAMLLAGGYNAVQLDINNYWVFFAAIRARGAQLDTVPLYPAMSDNKDRFLHISARDFFYITGPEE